MRVAMISRHSCIRVFKEGHALKRRGQYVELAAMMSTFGYNAFDTFSLYSDRDMLQRYVKEASKRVDLFHVHNEPDWLVRAVREVTDKPIIYDIHDLESLRWQREPDQDELDAFGMSQGWVHVSEPCRIAAEKIHGADKPSVTLPCYANEVFFHENPGDPSWNTVVYEGGLATTSALPAHRDDEQGTNFRNYVPVVKAFGEQGYNFMLFTTAQVTPGKYENVGGVVLGALSYYAMLMAIRPYGFGFVGASVKYPIMDGAMPNKLFEYISQGVVPVVYNAEEAGNFVEDLGIGIKLTSLDNLREQLKRGPECRERLLEVRDALAMERHIDGVIDLYEEVLCKSEQKSRIDLSELSPALI